MANAGLRKSVLKALDELKEGLENMYNDLEEADITESNFKEQAMDSVSEWADFAIRKSLGR